VLGFPGHDPGTTDRVDIFNGVRIRFVERLSRLLLLTGALPAILFAVFMALVTRLPPVLDLLDALVLIAYGAGLTTYRTHARRGLGGRVGRPWVARAYAVGLLLVCIAVFADTLAAPH
jgi:hypothetical protein